MYATLRFGALPFLAALLFGGIAAAAHGQGELTKGFVFTEKSGFIAGQRTTISAADSTVIPDPIGRYALIEHRDPPAGPAELLTGTPAEEPSSSLILYDAHTGRTKVVWRGDPLNHNDSITEVIWLSGTHAALVVTAEHGDRATGLMPDGRKAASGLLLVRPASITAIVQTVMRHEGDLSIHASPSAPIAIIDSTYQVTDPSGIPSVASDCMTVSERGEIGPTIPIAKRTFFTPWWSEDGLTTYFVEVVPASPGLLGAPPTKQKRQYIGFNTKTQEVTPIDKLPIRAKPADVPDPNPLRLVSGALTAPPPGAGPQQATAKPAQFAPLWAVRADGKHEGRLPTAAVIAPDSQASFLLADDSAVLYIADHTVYAVSLTHQRRPDFDAAYREMLKNQTMKNAKQVGLAMIMYSADYDEQLPPAAGVNTAINPYLKSSSSLNNPDTDTPAFTFLLGGQGIAAISSPATTAMGYLAGPGGRAVIYADGHVKWEDAN